jgi:ethanolamine utilization protein EutQ
VLEGNFRLRVGSEVYDAGPGDLIWIPENTPLRYEGEKARICYALFPVDWRKRHGMA